jgi:hypothetical protein
VVVERVVQEASMSMVERVDLVVFMVVEVVVVDAKEQPQLSVHYLLVLGVMEHKEL